MRLPAFHRWALPLALPVLLFFFAPIPEVAAEERTTNLYWIPENVTVQGEKIDEIFYFIFWLTTIVFVLVNAVFIYYLIRYRRRPGVKAYYSHGNNALEIVWTTIPAAIFLGLAIWSNQVWFELTKTPPPENALQVDITSYQFGFDMRYAGLDGKLGEADDLGFTVENKFGLIEDDPAGLDDFEASEFVIPANRPVHVFLRSRDVIHSFYVPQFRLYQDMVPGRTIGWMWFEVKRPGEFELACSQLCGTGHYNMKARIRVLPEEEFDKWYQERAEAAAASAGLLAPEQSVASAGSDSSEN